MILRSPALPLAAILSLLCPAAYATVRTHRHTSSHAIVRHSASARSTHAGRVTEHASSNGIGSDRATEIQSALIQRGYLTGEPTGTWDAASVTAMQKMQADNGWQTKFVPDSRAIIKLGLGANSTPASGSPAPALSTSAAVQTPQASQSY